MKILMMVLGLVVLSAYQTALGNDLVQKLQEISVTVATDHGSGSGVLKTRKIGSDNITFVWTANHVISGLRKTREIVDGRTGTKREVILYDDAKILQVINEDGRMVAEHTLIAKVIKVSEEEDLALLMVRKHNFSTASVQFYLDKKLPSLGDDVWNVGSALGIEGSNTASKGIYSQHGRLLRNHPNQPLKIYDQVSCPGFPGCSGSGVFLNDGRMAGMLTNGNGETFILVVPARRIVEWASNVKIDWAIDDHVVVPSLKDIDNILVEDNGITFGGNLPDRVIVPKHAKKMFHYNKTAFMTLISAF